MAKCMAKEHTYLLSMIAIHHHYNKALCYGVNLCIICFGRNAFGKAVQDGINEFGFAACKKNAFTKNSMQMRKRLRKLVNDL